MGLSILVVVNVIFLIGCLVWSVSIKGKRKKRDVYIFALVFFLVLVFNSIVYWLSR